MVYFSTAKAGFQLSKHSKRPKYVSAKVCFGATKLFMGLWLEAKSTLEPIGRVCRFERALKWKPTFMNTSKRVDSEL